MGLTQIEDKEKLQRKWLVLPVKLKNGKTSVEFPYDQFGDYWYPLYFNDLGIKVELSWLCFSSVFCHAEASDKRARLEEFSAMCLYSVIFWLWEESGCGLSGALLHQCNFGDLCPLPALTLVLRALQRGTTSHGKAEAEQQDQLCLEPRCHWWGDVSSGGPWCGVSLCFLLVPGQMGSDALESATIQKGTHCQWGLGNC